MPIRTRLPTALPTKSTHRREAWSTVRCIPVRGVHSVSTERSGICAWQQSSDRPVHPSRRLARGVSWVLGAMLALPASAQTASSGLKTDIVFTEYSTLSSAAELVRRLASPLSAMRIEQAAEHAG